MLPVLNIGSAAIQTRGLLLLVAFWLGFYAAERAARRLGLDADDIWNAGFVALLVGLVGARLAYAIRAWDVYTKTPRLLVSFNIRDMDWQAGILVGTVAFVLWLIRMRMPLARTADALVIGAAVAWAVAGVSAFLSGDAFGTPTALPWGVVMWGATRHPVQLYESIAGVVIAGLLWHWIPKRRFDGWLALVGVAMLAAARMFIETFRATENVLPGGLRAVQFEAWIILIAALALLAWLDQPDIQQSEDN
nr:prolipoprotein diacylglyceryl transferase family protein [Ardenticatena sp.]